MTKWSTEFKRGLDSLEFDSLPGRLVDVISADLISQEMIDRAERLVLNHRRIKLPNLLQTVVFLMEVLTL